MKTEIFEGHWTTEDKKPLSFNLYGYDNIYFEKTKENILSNFKIIHLKKMKKLFLKYGLKVHNLDYFSPREYNFDGDSIDLKISIANLKKLYNYIEKNKKQIQQDLDKNKSYDGYISLTESNTDEIKENIKDNKKISVMIISNILKEYPLDFYEDFADLLIYEEDEDEPNKNTKIQK